MGITFIINTINKFELVHRELNGTPVVGADFIHASNHGKNICRSFLPDNMDRAVTQTRSSLKASKAWPCVCKSGS